jgi:NAD(P)-dependent dehydrogenase (short-subunit alcohol dehydrogenase family)
MGGMLAGQSAIVTGAGRGFGRAIALHLASAGALITVTSRTQAQLDETVRLVESAGGTAFAVAGDATDGKTVRRVAAAAEKKFGPVAILVNNAGVPDPFGPVGEIDPDRWWAAQAIHVYAPLLFMNAVLPGMVGRGGGHIINVSAFGGTVVAPCLSAYCVGKAAQIRLTEHVAAEYREQGISAFAIDPGFVVTELAEQTLASPDAQRWLPGMMERLRSRKREPDAARDLDRCGRRCVDLCSGRYDSLSGKYMNLGDNLDEMLQQAAQHG